MDNTRLGNENDDDDLIIFDSKKIQYHTAVLTSQRDILNNVLFMEAATTVCLILASRHGYIFLQSGSELRQSVGPSYQLPVTSNLLDSKSRGSHGRQCNRLCDAVVMADAKTIVFALSDRSLQFYDTTCTLRSEAMQEHRHLWKVVGLPQCVTCLRYYEGTFPEPSLLFMGNEKGSVITLAFLQPSTVLFKRRSLDANPGQAESVYWPEILKSNGLHTQYVQVKSEKSAHNEKVLQLFYYHEQQTIISCSLDTKQSIVFMHTGGKMPTTTFSVDQGVRCFAFNVAQQLLASGSDDGVIRLWNPLVPAKPSACLLGHESRVIDVLFLSYDYLASFCSYTELRLWNTRHLNCIQKIVLHQPLPQYTIPPHSVYFWHNKNKLLVSLGLGIAVVPLLKQTNGSYESSHTSSENRASSPQTSSESSSDLRSNESHVTSTTSPVALQLELPITTNVINSRCDKFKETFNSVSALDVLTNRRQKMDEADGSDHDAVAGMNERIEQHLRKIVHKRQFLTQCTPHLALNLWPPTVIQNTKRSN